MAKKIVNLYIDDTSLRLLITRGKLIQKWADLPLEPGLVKNGVVLKEAEVVAKIKLLFEAQQETTKKVIVGISGLHCLSRPISLPQLPKVMLAEAVRREAKRVLPVSLEQLYISWQTIPSPEGKTRVFLVAVPRKTADALFKVLRQAGLKPYHLDLKPLLLTRMVKEATAIIVDVQATEFDIVIMDDGIPQPIRTVPLPSKELSWEEKLPMIKNELDRTIKFHNSNNPEKPLESTVPMFISGELADKPELYQSLSDDLGHPALLLPSPIEYPEGLNLSRYLVNIGLALKKLLSEKETGSSVTNFNALPTPYRPKPISLIRIIALPSVSIIVGLFILLVIMIQITATDIASIHGQLNTTDQLLQQKLSQRQGLELNITALENKIATVETAQNSFTTTLTSLEKQSNEINGNLKITVTSLPATVNLSSISQSGSLLTLIGNSLSEKEILSYLRNLDASGRFSEVTIINMRRVEDAGIDFTAVLRTGGQD